MLIVEIREYNDWKSLIENLSLFIVQLVSILLRMRVFIMQNSHNLLISYRFNPGIYYKILNIIVHSVAYFILSCSIILLIINNFKSVEESVFLILIMIYLFIRKYNMVKKIDLYDDNILDLSGNKV